MRTLPEPPPLLCLALATLREARGWTQHDLADASGVSRRLISRYETVAPPPMDRMQALLGVLGYDADDLDVLLRALAAVGTPDTPLPPSPLEPSPDELRHLHKIALRRGLSVASQAEPALIDWVRQHRAETARRKAAQLWSRLRTASPAERRLLVEASPEFQTWALAERLCHESATAAADSAQRARELADLARLVAERIPGDPRWRARLLGYCLAFLANALRVGNDMRGADQAFSRGLDLWRKGAPADPELLAEWRLLDLEGSLRRDQRRFAESLDCLDRARAIAPPEHAARILLKKAVTLEHQGDFEAAIVVLREASPLVDAEREPRFPWSLRFNLAANLCLLERFAEAGALLPEVRELAVALRNELDLVRVLWLEARVAAGTGRTDEARAAFEQVRRNFATRKMAYDGALVSLEMAVLLLEQGRTGQVRRLAEEMVWIFQGKGIHREALAALTVFRQAAAQETATLELTRRILRFLERVQRDPELRFEG